MGNNKIHSFFALEVTRDGLNQVFANQNKQKMPIVSEDKLEEFQDKIIASIKYCDELCISYFCDGVIKSIIGIVEKFDALSKEIVLTNKRRLAINLIVQIDIVETY